MNKKIIIILLTIIVLCLLFTIWKTENFQITKTHKLNVIKLVTPEEKRKGLMFVKNKLGANKGALFQYDDSKKYCIWMKNTFIPLDVIFLDHTFKIVDYIKNARPQDLTSRCSSVNSKYFIEVDAGYIKNNNIQLYDKIQCNYIEKL